MDGVSILNIYTKYTYTFGWSLTGVLFAITTVIVFVIFMYSAIDEGNFTACCIALLCLSFGGAFSFMSFNTANEMPYSVYEVTIDENVSFQEFNQKYEILEQRGRIYVIKEREEDK